MSSLEEKTTTKDTLRSFTKEIETEICQKYNKDEAIK